MAFAFIILGITTARVFPEELSLSLFWSWLLKPKLESEWCISERPQIHNKYHRFYWIAKRIHSTGTVKLLGYSQNVIAMINLIKTITPMI